MDVTLYINASDNKRVNKELSGAKPYTCTFRREVSIDQPVIEITTSDDIRGYNYVHIPMYGRYYHTKVSAGPNNCYTLTCKSDPLMSFKGDFLLKEAIIKRSASLYNLYMDDGNFYISSKMRRQVKAFSGSLSDPGDNFILITA